MAAPIHPGEILREELNARKLSANRLAKAIGVPTNRITAILNGTRGVSADTALRLGGFFGNDPRFWLALQSNNDLARARGNTL